MKQSTPSAATSATSNLTGDIQATKPLEEKMLRQPASASTSLAPVAETDIQQRMEVIEEALRFQTAVGASHLQQVELDPAAFGLPVAARTPVRRLRRKRNRALHVVTSSADNALVTGSASFMLKCNNEHCDAEVQKVDYEDDFASWGGPLCSECGHTMGGIGILSEVPDPASAIA